MISRVASHWRWLRRLVSRNRWSAKIVGVKAARGEAAEPGLIMIQLDGLSRTQFERAMDAGRLPFLRQQIQRQHFSLETFYSGIPSTTPAVQAEIFYGVKAAVPAFQFLRRKAGRDFRMYEAESASEIEADLLAECPDPLLRGGHSYSNIYPAGAAASWYCSRDFATEEILRNLHPFKQLLLALVYLPKIVRMISLALVEIGVALCDAICGVYDREDVFKELAFVPARVAVCVILREMIRFRMLLDIERGVPVIHANFLGYDEQAHRRGPGSLFAHWSLKAIDRAIRDVYRTAADSRFRDYEVIVYSDHGQEKTTPYLKKCGRNLDAALQDVFADGPLAGRSVWMRKHSDLLGNTLNHCRLLFGFHPTAISENVADPETQIVVTAMGPLGHIYFPEIPDAASLEDACRRMVTIAHIPLVLVRCGEGRIRAFNPRGDWSLPGDAAEILGADHPSLAETTADLIRMCEHPDAGDVVISGWDPHSPPLTFVMENGAHGGPGTEETRGFLLVPDRIRRWHLRDLPATRRRVRGEDLRKIALHYLGRDGEREERISPAAAGEWATLRVMTYNVHSCVGMDSKIRPERIARVINHCDPDIVGVQEVDCHRPRSGGHDQAQLIADHLRMHHVFQTMLQAETERYGIAIFSKHPLEIMRAGNLTEAVPSRFREARGAIWVRVKIAGGRHLHFLNTHFGLGRGERREQMSVLAGPDWLGAIPPDEPVVLCGDFNTGPRSKIFHELRSLRDAQRALPGFKPRPTFASVNPFLRLDHVFVSDHFNVESVELPDSPTAVVASDHLPLCIEISLNERA